MMKFQRDLARSNEALPGAIETFQRMHGGDLTLFSPDCNDGGIDVIWTDPSGLEWFIDFKILFWPDNGLIPLEYRDSAGRPGWAVDGKKATDLFAFYWVHANALRVYQAPRLRLAAINNVQTWLPDANCFKKHRNYVAFVPAANLEAAMQPDALIGMESRAI